MLQELALYRISEALDISQTEMAAATGIKQPALACMEGEQSIVLKFPNGKRVAFDI